MTEPKLYVVVRADLPAGQQAVQAVHAALAFQREHREVCVGLDNLALLAAPDERSLAVLIRSAGDAGVPWESFQEPDLGDQLTAVALGPAARRLVSSLPLALRLPAALPVRLPGAALAPAKRLGDGLQDCPLGHLVKGQ